MNGIMYQGTTTLLLLLAVMLTSGQGQVQSQSQIQSQSQSQSQGQSQGQHQGQHGQGQGFELEERHGHWTVNTCGCGSGSGGSNPRTRFRACKLVSLKSAIADALNIVRLVELELHMSHSRNIPTVVINTTHSEVDLFYTGYEQLQMHTLDFLILDLFQSDIDLTFPACDLVRHLRRAICLMRPVLEAGTFPTGNQQHTTTTTTTPGCDVRRVVHAPRRSDLLNFAENVVHNATSELTWMVSSINVILTDLS